MGFGATCPVPRRANSRQRGMYVSCGIKGANLGLFLQDGVFPSTKRAGRVAGTAVWRARVGYYCRLGHGAIDGSPETGPAGAEDGIAFPRGFCFISTVFQRT